MKELGLYTPQGFETDEQIKEKYMLEPALVQNTPFSSERSFSQWGVIFSRRQQERKEQFTTPEHIEVTIETPTPILLVPFGDIHAGGQDVDYERFVNELSMVSGTKGAFALTLGDITDSFFWGGSAQDNNIASFGEQNAFMREATRELKGKLIAGWLGDHDGWAAERGETMYHDFQESTGAHLLHGVSYITLHVGKETYKISGAHRHNGFSNYNAAHPELRMYRDDAEGADIVVGAHTHKKGYLMQSVKRFGGVSENVHYLSVGPYKETDEYARKKGFHRLTQDEIGPQGILLWPDQKRIEVCPDVTTGISRLSQEKSKYTAVQYGTSNVTT